MAELLDVPRHRSPFELGFVATLWLNRLLAASPALNTVLAGLRTVFVAMQSSNTVWTLMVEGRLRPGLAALFMFTCRGILGYSTHRYRLPLRPPNFFVYQMTSAGLDGRNCYVHYKTGIPSSVLSRHTC